MPPRPLMTHSTSNSTDSPLPTPSWPFLEHDSPQFATFQNEVQMHQFMTSPEDIAFNEKKRKIKQQNPKSWTPIPLRRRFWIPFICSLVIIGVGLEVALKVSNARKGWQAYGNIEDEGNIMHYVYTLPPVAIAAVIVALWGWTDIEIKTLQPYIDLVHGDATPERSLLLDYIRISNFFVWTKAAHNRHYLVALTSLMLLMSLSFQPISAALLVVKDTYWRERDVLLNTLAMVGLNENLQFDDLTSFLSASGFAGAAVLYNLGDTPFVRGAYTIAPFEMPPQIRNGTVFANTTALKSDTGCVSVPVSMVKHADGNGWSNSATLNGCSMTWEVDKNSTTLFGTDAPVCVPNVPAEFSPVIFWFFTYIPSARSSATFCYPTFSIWDVTVAIDIASKNVTRVTELQPFSSTSRFSQYAGNVTGPPLNGLAYNGVMFDLTNPDQFILARANATRLQLPAAVYQAALKSPQGLVGSFDEDNFTPLVQTVYSTYMALIAREVYFLPVTSLMATQVTTLRKRVFLSPTAVHLLATGLLILAFFGLLIHLFHRLDRRDLRLSHEPGTIASAVSIAAGTGVAGVLAGQQARGTLHDALHGRRFMMDPDTGLLVMDCEEEYRRVPRRRSTWFESFGGTLGGEMSPKTPYTDSSLGSKYPEREDFMRA